MSLFDATGMFPCALHRMQLAKLLRASVAIAVYLPRIFGGGQPEMCRLLPKSRNVTSSRDNGLRGGCVRFVPKPSVDRFWAGKALMIRQMAVNVQGPREARLQPQFWRSIVVIAAEGAPNEGTHR